MKKNKILIVLTVLMMVGGVFLVKDGFQNKKSFIGDVPLKESRFEEKHIQRPAERYKVRQELTFRENGDNYRHGYLTAELVKAKTVLANARGMSTELVERGPSNVPGRARGLMVLPQDESHKTWLVGSSGGGIWKTTDGGESWTEKSADFPSLAVTTFDFPASNPDIIYAGTGEYIASAFTAINGDGLFKSLDAGETWTQITSTAGDERFQSVTRLIVNPENPDIVLVSTAPNTWGNTGSYILKTIDGGMTWSEVFNAPGSNAVEQIKADYTDFNRIYAGQNGVGMLVSIDMGNTWSVISKGMNPTGRVEFDISPVDPSRLYASTVGGNDANQEADIYYSTDSGENWTLVIDPENNVDVLGGQGWYDNTVLAHPFNLDEFYIGGIGIYKYTIGDGEESTLAFLGAEENGTDAFMGLTDFGNGVYYNGTIAIGTAPQADWTSVEIRFGSGKSQKAHRFTVPANSGSGVPDNQYAYADYVDVPFEVWDISANPERQLMVAFRDQQNDGIFNLLPENTEGGATDANNSHAREYIFINTRTYAEAPSTDMATNGGHVNADMFFIWPYLQPNATWDESTLPDSEFVINWGEIVSGVIAVESIADPYGRFDDKNNNVHPDHHNLVSVIHDEVAKTWQIINVNDGASYSSDIAGEPGLGLGVWDFAGSGMNTTQFYGADKAPGVSRYVGGAQDNGSWFSIGGGASANTSYNEGWGGDGFDAVWHSEDINKMIVTSQNLGIGRTVNGGQSFVGGTSGLNDSDPPFIGQFANSPSKPDLVWTAGASGLWKSEDFAATWSLVNMSNKAGWAAISSMRSVALSEASQDVIWAGSSVTASNSLYVSTDNGGSFKEVKVGDLNTGNITGIGTDPFDYQTAYVLFSYANSPKIVKTTDLGDTWTDISGYSPGSTSTGFPDVAVYDLVVMPSNQNHLWAGTEIGIVESLDGGATWSLLDTNMPNVSVWDLKIKEDEIVIATHGRGIWSYTMPEPVLVTYFPELDEAELKDGLLTYEFETRSNMDLIEVYISGDLETSIESPAIGTTKQELNYNTDSEELYMVLKGVLNGAPFHSDTLAVEINNTPILGMDDEISAIKVYPNPTSKYLDIQSSSEYVVNGMFIVDMQGKVVLNKTDFTSGRVDLSKLATGIYLVNMVTNKGKVVKRIEKI